MAAKTLDWIDGLVRDVYGPYVLDRVTADVKNLVEPTWPPDQITSVILLYLDTITRYAREQARRG